MRRIWRGRRRRQIERAFVALGDTISMGQAIRYVWPRRSRFRPGQYERVREALAEIADPLGRGTTKGRPVLWRLRSEYQSVLQNFLTYAVFC
jgi:hypothetical protein